MPLLLVLWDRGIRTCNSCQETNPGFMWIEFVRFDDLKKFIDILLDGISYQNLALYNRIMGNAWRYEISLLDNRKDFLDQEEMDGPTFMNFSRKSDIDISPSVRFPISDFDMVLKAFSKKRSSS